MNKRVCIVIPIYKKKLSRYEKLSIDLVIQKLSCYDIYFATYKEMNMSSYGQYKGIKVKYFPRRYFRSIFSYSRLLLKENFYQKFSAYKYMLIVQDDALVLGSAEQLESFMNKNFDYWGARWEKPVEIGSFDIEKKLKKKLLPFCPDVIQKLLFKNPRSCSVGNGGLSLRNNKKTIALLREKKIYAWLWLDNEDKFFAYHGLDNHAEYRIAPESMVDEFSVESMIRQLDVIKPFGLHGWDRIGHSYVLKYLKQNNIL